MCLMRPMVGDRRPYPGVSYPGLPVLGYGRVTRRARVAARSSLLTLARLRAVGRPWWRAYAGASLQDALR